MWFGKFLDLTDEIKGKAKGVRKNLFSGITKDKLTPLEFTMLETIFNNEEISGYDLIQNMNKHFAGTWEAKSGTVYPILSKLKAQGFLKIRTVKSPIGPLKKLYLLTDAGIELLKVKVNKNFLDQVKFMENNLLELSSIYIHSFPPEEKDTRIEEVINLVKDSYENIIERIPTTVAFKVRCPHCKLEIDRKISFCPHCGGSVYAEKVDDMKPAEEINGE